MKKIILFIFLLINLLSVSAFAADLLQVFHQALACDPSFKAAESQYLATRENVPIARSSLLPSLILTGQTQRQVINATIQSRIGFFSSQSGTFYNTFNEYQLNLVQPIFNYSAWAQLSTASYQAKQAEATFAAAAQDLMIRTAQAYFGILQASDNLRYTQEQKKAVAEQLRQTRQQYEVGLVAITGVKEAEANYDSLVAEEIAAKNNLANAVEQLRAITTKTYPNLQGAGNRLPLVQPLPADIDRWVDVSERQNYSLAAAINGAMAAEQNIKVKRGGHFPVLNGTAGYLYQHNSAGAISGGGTIGPSETQSDQVGVAVTFPIFQGGLVNAQTRQADYLYQNAVSQMEFTHRNVVQQTRDAYLGVITGINKIEADRQTVIANTVALKATRDGYDAGTRTMLDVLNAQSTLYQSQKDYSVDRYNYLISLLSLKQSAGTLSPSDLIQVNTWLTTNISILGKISDIGSYGDEIPAVFSKKGVSAKKVRQPKRKIEQTKKKLIKVNSQPVSSMSAKKQIEIAKNAVSEMTSYYSIELFDTRYESHAKNFIQIHNLGDKATYIRTVNAKNEPRFQVIYGHYKTLQHAEAAVKTLPPDLKKLNPWIKVFKK